MVDGPKRKMNLYLFIHPKVLHNFGTSLKSTSYIVGNESVSADVILSKNRDASRKEIRMCSNPSAVYIAFGTNAVRRSDDEAFRLMDITASGSSNEHALPDCFTIVRTLNPHHLTKNFHKLNFVNLMQKEDSIRQSPWMKKRDAHGICLQNS